LMDGRAGLPSPEPCDGPVGTKLSIRTQTNGSSDVTAKLGSKTRQTKSPPTRLDKSGGCSRLPFTALASSLAAGAKTRGRRTSKALGGGIAAKGAGVFGDKAIGQQVLCAVLFGRIRHVVRLEAERHQRRCRSARPLGSSWRKCASSEGREEDAREANPVAAAATVSRRITKLRRSTRPGHRSNRGHVWVRMKQAG